MNKVTPYLNLAYDLASKKNEISCNDGTTLLVNIQHLQFLTETAKTFQSSEKIGWKTFYNTPLDAAFQYTQFPSNQLFQFLCDTN